MKRLARKIFGVLRFAIAIGLLVYLGVSGAINWSLFRGLASAWPSMLVALAFCFASMAATSWRLCTLFKPRQMHLSFFASVRLTLIGMFFNNCLPGSVSGDLIKIYYAVEGNKGRRTEVATIIFLDRATGMFGIVLLPLLIAPFSLDFIRSVPLLTGLIWMAITVLVVMLIGLAVSFSQSVRHSRLLTWCFDHVPLGHYAEKVLDTVYLYRHDKRSLLAAVGISLIAHSCTIAMALPIAAAFHTTGFTWRISILMPFGFLANTVPLTPGGLGVGEAALDKLFTLAGLSGGAETFLGVRIGMVLISLLGLAFYLQGRRAFVRDHQKPVGFEDELALKPLYSSEQ